MSGCGTAAASTTLLALQSAGFHPIMQNFPHGAIIVFDHELRYVCAGGLGLADVGLSREMLEGNTIFEVFAPDVVAAIETTYRQALAGQECSIDVPFQDRIYLQHLGPLRDADGNIVAGLGFTQEVTAARHAERELRESVERFRLAFEHAPIAKALIGVDGRLELVNPAMCAFTGYTEKELLALTFADLMTPEDLVADRSAMAELTRGTRTNDMSESKYVTASGSIVWGAKSSTLVRRDDGSPLHFIVQIQDISARKATDWILAEERRRLRDAEAVGRVGSWEMEVPSGDVVWSDGMFALWGVAPDTFGHDYNSAVQAIHPDDVDTITAAVAACRTSGTPIRHRYRIIRDYDKSLRWIDAHGKALYQDGVIVRIAGAVTDVTELVEAESEARAAQSFQQAVFSASPDTIAVWDLPRWSIVWANRSIVTMLGYSEQETAAIGDDLTGQLVHTEDLGQLLASIAAAEAAPDDEVFHVDFRLRHRDGSYRWFSRRTAPLQRDTSGRVTQIVGITRDTTDTMAVEAALRESEAMFSQLAESVDVAFLLRSWDPPQFLYVSPGYQKVFGYDPMSAEETPDNALLRLHPDDVANFYSEYWDRSAAGLSAQFEYRIFRPDGTERWVRAKTAPVAGPPGSGRRSASTVEDITASRTAEAAMQAVAAAEKANEAMGEFLSRLSHELRTPLNAILGFAQLLEMDELTEMQREAITHIMRGGHHLVALIDDVLDISKIEGERLFLVVENVPVPELLTQTVDMMRPLAAAAGVEIVAPIGGGGNMWARADTRRLRQVVLNLLSNAIKYNRPGGRVDVTTQTVGDSDLEIVVRDNGIGISPEDLPRLFTPFDRLGAQATTIEGSGVGLALSHRLMTIMAGTLRAGSVFGSGSTFTATIPLATDSQLADATPDRAVEQRPGRTAALLPTASTRSLLYIEDDSSNIDLIAGLVARRSDWRLVVAGHGALGLELAAATSPDLILLDLHLPGANGTDLLDRLRADDRTRHLEIVVISADENAHQVDSLLGGVAKAFLTAPLDVGEFLQLLDSVGHID